MGVVPATAQTLDEVDRQKRKAGVAEPHLPMEASIKLGVQERWREGQLDEVERWAKLGVAVVHGAFGQKGPWPDNWPRLAFAETWHVAREAVKRGRSNLAVRLGETVNGHYLAHADLDGKCPCGSDLADHDSGGRCLSEKCRTTNECTCRKYHGVAPDIGLGKLLALLPDGVCVVKTGRGYRVLFFTASPIAESVLLEFGADVAAHSGRLSIIPPSRHPGGQDYVYVRPPGDCLPVVHLENLGLFPQPKVSKHRGGAAGSGGSCAGVPEKAAPRLVERFVSLMRGLNVFEGCGTWSDRRGEFFVCPWHPDTQASLHVLWKSAIFCCFGCELSGGVRELQAMSEGSTAPSRKLPNGDSQLGNRGTNGGAHALTEKIASLADALRPGTLNVDGRQLRECRQYVLTYHCSEGHEFAPRDERGNPTPLSCDASSGICPSCGPRRFLQDARAADVGSPERVRVFRLVAETPGLELFDLSLSRRLTARLKAYRKSHMVTAGSAARSLHLEPDGTAFRGHFIVAVPLDMVERVVSDGAFSAKDLGEGSLEDWHRLQLAEHMLALEQLETPAQLEAFYLAMHGQQMFRHFGAWYGKRVDAVTGELTVPKSAGGAGSNGRADAAERVCCPIHPRATVTRVPPTLRSSLVRGEGGVLLPSARGPGGLRPGTGDE